MDWSKIPGIEDVAAGIGVSPSPALLKAAKNIKWFHAMGAGMENPLSIPAVAAGNYLLTNSPASLIPQVADNAIAMAIALMRGLDLYDKMAATKHMEQPDFGQRGMQIEGRTLLVVGLGGIGNQVAALAYGLGMKVIATRGSSRNGPPYVDQVGLANELPDLIGKADVVVMAAPLTAETEHLFDAKMFARMKKGAIFVNVGRGKQVVQADLIAALKSGQVGAAGLEVTDPEPLPDGDPLWDAPNLMLMTHAGAPAQPPEGIDTYRQKEWIIARENMRRYTAGEKMLDVVDPKRGY
jgi:phosphoglycerate dehydrogenase-like enzyme